MVSDIPAGDRKIDNLFYSVAPQMKAHLLTEEKQNSLGENHHSWRKKLARKSQRAVKISEWLKIRELQQQLYDSGKQSGLGKP